MSFTVCTTYYRSARMPRPVLARSCAAWEVPLEAFGTRHKFDTFYRTKIVSMLGFLKRCKTSHVLFLDANDTFFVRPFRDLENAYEEVGKGRVVVGSEVACWPHRSLRRFFKRLSLAKGFATPFRYLDTGLIMGPTEEVKKTLRRLVARLPAWRKEFKHLSRDVIEDDVGMWALGIRDGIIDPVIDYNAALIVPLRQLKKRHYDVKGGKLFVKPTGTYPPIIHCNGQRQCDRKLLRLLYRQITGETRKACKIPVGRAR